MQGADWLQAASTSAACAASLTALYLGVLRPYRLRPILRLIDPGDDPVATTESKVEDDDSIWMRIRVLNDSSSVSASDVSATIMWARSLTDGTPRPLLVGRTLKWSNVEEWEVRVPPKMARHLDVARLKHVADGTVQQILPIFPRPIASSRHIVKTTELEIELALSAENAETSYWRLVLRFADEWPSAVSDGVRLVEPIAPLQIRP